MSSCLSGPAVEQQEPQPQQTKQENSAEHIHDLIRSGNSQAARDMFSSRVDINIQDADGNTPLHIAARINDAELIQFLMYKGAALEEKNNAGHTPLHEAIRNNAADAVRELTTEGASIFTEYEPGKNALTLASGGSDAVLDALINQESVRQRNETGQLPLVYNEQQHAVRLVVNVFCRKG